MIEKKVLDFLHQKKKKKLDELMFREIIGRIDDMISRVREESGADAYDRGGDIDEHDCRTAADGCGGSSPVGILLDAPLLFEAGLDTRCDLILLMVADEEVRIRRVCDRDGVTAREVRNRINSQMTDEEKRIKSHVIVDNSTSREDMEIQLENFFAKFSKNSCKRFNAVL